MAARLLSVRAAVLAAVLAWPGSLQSQVRGTVADETGRPLQGVHVELWSNAERVAALLTDAQGAFTVSARQLEQTARLTLRRIGFRMLAAAKPTVLQFTLRSLPMPLPELTVTATRRRCPSADQVEARTLWRATSLRYSDKTLFRGVAWYGTALRGEVEPETVGTMDESGLTPAWARFVGAVWPPGAGRFRQMDSVIARSGYAERVNPVQAAASDYFDWRYAELDARHAAHFASSVFGSRHTLQILDRNATGVVLAFCPINRNADIEGTLTIAGDSTFVSAAWTFRTPKPDEGAGGEVAFAPPVPGSSGLPHLLAVRGTFWRRISGTRLYFQRATVYLRWLVGPDASMPPIP